MNNLLKVVTQQCPGAESNLRLCVTSGLQVRHVTVRLPSHKWCELIQKIFWGRANPDGLSSSLLSLEMRIEPTNLSSGSFEVMFSSGSLGVTVRIRFGSVSHFCPKKNFFKSAKFWFENSHFAYIYL